MSLKGLIQRFIHTPTLDPESKKKLKARGLRPGMWVRYNDSTGIVLKESTEDPEHIEIMLVDPVQGLNTLMVSPHNREIRQARFREIPKLRRPSPELAAMLGYDMGDAT